MAIAGIVLGTFGLLLGIVGAVILDGFAAAPEGVTRDISVS